MSLRETHTPDIYKQYADFYQLGWGGLLLIIGIWLGSLLKDGYASNVYTEILGIIVVIVVLDWRARQRAKAELRSRLIREAGSRGNDTAVTAIEWLRTLGWLSGDESVLIKADLHRANLRGAYLFDANLEGAYLFNANLQNSNLFGARLQNTNLEEASMENAYLYNASLRDANLFNANLERANLEGADLEQAYLGYTNLCGAFLANANLANAKLAQVEFDMDTVLPDARIVDWDDKTTPVYDKYWTARTDMSRYTDPNHPNFWQPDWARPQKSVKRTF